MEASASSPLPSEAFNSGTHTQTLQLTDTHVFSAKIVSDSALQYIRTRSHLDAISAAPAVVVQGAFSSGGSPAQALHDNLDRLELREELSIAHGTHFIRTGGRYRLTRDANLATAGYNGQFTFSSLTAYQLTEQGIAAHQTDAQIRSTCVTGTDGTTTCGGATPALRRSGNTLRLACSPAILASMPKTSGRPRPTSRSPTACVWRASPLFPTISTSARVWPSRTCSSATPKRRVLSLSSAAASASSTRASLHRTSSRRYGRTGVSERSYFLANPARTSTTPTPPPAALYCGPLAVRFHRLSDRSAPALVSASSGHGQRRPLAGQVRQCVGGLSANAGHCMSSTRSTSTRRCPMAHARWEARRTSISSPPWDQQRPYDLRQLEHQSDQDDLHVGVGGPHAPGVGHAGSHQLSHQLL